MDLPKVTFADYGKNIASSRLRAAIPQRELEKLGVNKGRDILVYGKHLVTLDQVKKFSLAVYDICDDHFHDSLMQYYYIHARSADLVTCNSETMKDIIYRETARDAIVIPDPYESEEKPAGIGEGALWFGHESNLVDLEPYLDLNPKILTGENWSREKQDLMLSECAYVLIPTGKSMAKSANRLIDAVRNGRFVIAGELPAHDEFNKFMWIGDIRAGVEWFNLHQKEAIERITECQRYIEKKYSPESISKLWFNTLEKLWRLEPLHN